MADPAIKAERVNAEPGTGTITPLRLLGAVAVLAGVLLGLSRARQVPADTMNPADQSPAQHRTDPASAGASAEPPIRRPVLR
jgi:hypothetical protein